jgi:hypothetical protein
MSRRDGQELPSPGCPSLRPMPAHRRSAARAEGLVEEIDPDTDAVKSLPETDVETEFHTRLLLMKDMRQLDDDASVFGHFGKAFAPAQEKGEIIANIGLTGVQAKRHRSISGGSKGEGSHRSSSNSPRRTQPAPAAWKPARLSALWL